MADVNKIDEATPYQKMRDVLTGLLNRCNEACGLTIGGTATKIKTAAAVDFTINGRIYTKAATDNITITAGAVQPISTFCKYLVSIIADGTVAVTKGNDGTTAALALVADLPADSAPLGWFQIATNGSTTFTAGTTSLAAAGITDTYADLSCIVTES
jgi:hypothetical protein